MTVSFVHHKGGEAAAEASAQGKSKDIRVPNKLKVSHAGTRDFSSTVPTPLAIFVFFLIHLDNEHFIKHILLFFYMADIWSG